MFFGSGNVFTKKQTFVTYFNQSVSGLSVGSNLKYKGVTDVLQVWRRELISLADAPRILGFRSVQMAAIRTGGDPPDSRLVFALLAFVPGHRGIAR